MYFSRFIFAIVSCCVAIDGAIPSRHSRIYDDYVSFPNAQGKLKLHSTPASWRDAHLKCYHEGAILASPENEALLFAMSDTLLENYEAPPYVFTGIHDTFSKGSFFSLEGTPVEKLPLPWVRGKPSLANDETCLSMNHNGTLSDGSCTDRHPFFCFKRDQSPPTGYDSRLTDCGPSSNGYTLDASTGSCYKFHEEDVYWRTAFATCADEGAHLAIINSQNESNVLKNLFSNNAAGRTPKGAIYSDVVHIGFVNWGSHKSPLWMTIHGQTLKNAGYDNWDPAEPNNRDNQLCGGMYIGGGLDDVNCFNGDPNKGTRSFICEKKPKIAQDATSN